MAAALAAGLCLGGCTAGEPSGGTVAPGSPSAVAPNSLPTAELEAFAREAIDEGAPAVVVHVRDGGRDDAKAAGMKDLESREPAAPEHRLWISGAGAPMVAVAVMRLAENGRVRLDDPVSAHLPEFAALVPAWNRTTIRELLGSRTGLPDYIPALIGARTAAELVTVPLTFEERLRLAAGVGGSPGPLSGPVWSATDWEVLAWLLERMHGRPLADVLRTDVFEPAGMGSSMVAAPGPPPEPMLRGYILSDGDRLDFTRVDAVAGSGDAGIISTVGDLSRFLAALTGGRLLQPGSWASMTGDESYVLGGLQLTGDICPGQRHVFIFGGGGAYNVQSFSSLDGGQQVSAGMALPPAALDPASVPPVVIDMEEAVTATVESLCAGGR